MAIKCVLTYPIKGKGRPQILLIGNGMEQCCGQPSWDDFLNEITLPERKELLKNENVKRISFPLRYELLSTPLQAPTPLRQVDIDKEENQLRKAAEKLNHKSNELLDGITELGVDHIFTTNYSYCIENAFWPKANFMQSKTRSKHRVDLRGDGAREITYRLHTAYQCSGEEKADRTTGIWHIHGECGVSRGVVLGHDRYGRLLSKIIDACNEKQLSEDLVNQSKHCFTSWPELFLFGDVYIVGFGYDQSEFDLWWLLRRKQRERFADGSVYFYEMKSKKNDIKQLLLKANGVQILNLDRIIDEDTTDAEYLEFYRDSLKDIKARVEKSRVSDE